MANLLRICIKSDKPGEMMRDEFKKCGFEFFFDMDKIEFWTEVIGIMEALDCIFDISFWEEEEFASKAQFKYLVKFFN